jgi:hypothetical protein
MEMEGQLPSPTVLPVEWLGTHGAGGSVVPRAGMDGSWKSQQNRTRSRDLPTRSESSSNPDRATAYRDFSSGFVS